jgi:beta-phosphoglucomutase
MVEGTMRQIDGFIFDMDGILFDTEKVSLRFWKKILKKYGYVMNKEIYITLIGRNRKAGNKMLIERYGEDLPIEKIRGEKDIEMLKFIYEKGVPVKKGVYELLDFLTQRGYRVAVATSTCREKAVDLLESAGIRDKFRAIICGDDVVNSKPNPEIFLKAAEKLEVDPKRCIVFEDSPVGVAAAHNGGMMVINIPDLKEPDHETEILANKICVSLLEVRDYLENLDLVKQT